MSEEKSRKPASKYNAKDGNYITETDYIHRHRFQATAS